MKLLNKLIGLFVPRETPPDPPPTPPTDGRPEYVPEKFFDKDAGVLTEQLARGYTELEGKVRSNKEALVAELDAERLAATPETYELKMPENLEIPEGVNVKLEKDDPMVEWFFGFAKENHLSQETVDLAIEGYIKNELKGMPSFKDELAKLGDYGADRHQKLENWLKGALDEEQFNSMQPLIQSAEIVMALEKLMSLKSGPVDFDGDGGGDKPMSLAEIRQMQNTPEYWREKNPVLIKKVEDAYKRLYGTGKLDTGG